MAKRIAEIQLSKDGVQRSSDDDEPSGVSLATAEIMAKRKILKPNGRSFTPPSASTSSIFSGFGTPASSSADIVESETLKALANKFVAAINKGNHTSVPDFRETCEKYLEYYKKIKDGKFGTSLGASVSQLREPKKGSESFGLADSARTQLLDKSTELPVSTRLETTSSKPTTNPFSGISFGNLSRMPSLSKAEAAINPSAGVSFVETTLYESSKTSETASAIEPVSIDEGSESDSKEEKRKEIKIAGPSFRISSRATMKNSPFSFNKKPATNVPGSNSNSEIQIKGPTFALNNKILGSAFTLEKANDLSEKPGFDMSTDAGSLVPQVTSVFNFGNPQASTETVSRSSKSKTASDVPAQFAFDNSTGSSSERGNPATSSFGSASTSKPELKTRLLLSGAPKTENTIETRAGAKNPAPFLFCGSSSSSENKPAFLFNSASSASENKSAFLFISGSSLSDSKSPFLFGNAASSTEVKPAFLSETSNTTAPFLVRSSNSSSEIKAPFSFGSAESKAPATSLGSTSCNDNDASEGKQDNEAESETYVNFAPVATLSEKMIEIPSGEENETVILQLRAKLMLFDAGNKDEPYMSMGVGELKVLKSMEGNSSRILLRADGALRVLLNTALVGKFKYETMGDGSLVRVPVVNADGQIVTYVLKVKTASDGTNLARVLSETKN